MADQSPTRLTYIITGLQYGGATIGMTRLLSELDPDEYNITVVSLAATTPDIKPLIPDHVETYHAEITSPREFWKIAPLIRIFFNSDILVCSLFHATLVGVPLGKLTGINNVLVWQHATEYKTPLRERYYKSSYWLSDRVLADSKAVESMLATMENVPREKISTLPIVGIDTDLFSPDTGTKQEDIIRVGTIGRLVEDKGYWELIKCAEYLGPDFEFEVIGDGELKEEFRDQSPSNVTFLGRVDNKEIANKLPTYDIYFQPSHHEGLCMTVIEAMACGLPIVASSVGGITESVVNGETGYLCSPRSIDCFCEKLRELGENPDLRTEFGERGRTRALSRYSSKALVEGFLDAVEECNDS